LRAEWERLLRRRLPAPGQYPHFRLGLRGEGFQLCGDTP